MTFATSPDLVVPACLSAIAAAAATAHYYTQLLLAGMTFPKCCISGQGTSDQQSLSQFSNFKDDFAKNAWEVEGGEGLVEAGVCFWRSTNNKGSVWMVW